MYEILYSQQPYEVGTMIIFIILVEETEAQRS